MPTRYRRNQAVRYYSGAAIKYKRSKSKRKRKKKHNKKTQRGFIAGATTIQFPFVKKTRTYKHRFGTKGTYGAAELHAMLETMRLALDTISTLPEDLQERPLIFYSNSKYVLDGITNYLPKWKANNWKSIRYVREQKRTQEMNEEYDAKWPHIAEMVEGVYKNPLEGTIANLELWQEIDQTLEELDKLPNKVHFRKCNRRHHLKFRKRTLKAAKDALYESALAMSWTQYRRHLRNLNSEEKLQESREDATFIRNSHKRITYAHLKRYLNSRWSLPAWAPVLEESGSTPETTPITEEAAQPGNDHTYVPVGTNKLPTRLSPVPTSAGQSALYPVKVQSDPTSVTTLSLSGTSQTGINKRCDETSIASDDLSVGDYMVPHGDYNDRDLKLATKRDLQEEMVSRPPPTIPCRPGAPLFATSIIDTTPIVVEKNPHGGINLRKGKRVVHGIRTDLPVYQQHKDDLNWWFQ